MFKDKLIDKQIPRHKVLSSNAYVACVLLLVLCFPNNVMCVGDYNVLDFGAVKDGLTDNREAIQKAIDAACKAGGGRVVVPPGKYLTGGVEIKDNVTFYVAAGATILGSKDLGNYAAHDGFSAHGDPAKRKCLISVANARNVTICGSGTIDGQGLHYWENQPESPHWIKAKPERPNALLEVADSENIIIRDVTLTNSPHWTCHILHCEDVVIDGIRIINSLFAPNADGIDITGSKDVRVANCDITTCDDGVVLKTWKNGKPCEDITVTNCTVETLCVAFKLGTESYADYRRVTFSNSVVKASSRLFGIYVRDGATVENISVSNIVGSTRAPLVLTRPIQIMITRRNKDSHLGKIRNVKIDQMICRTDGRVLLTADEGASIDNLSISNLHLDYPFIEDPQLVLHDNQGGQLPMEQKEALRYRAAVIAKNLNDFQLKDLTISWPDNEVPDDWKIPVRIVNGDFEMKFEHDYDTSRQAEFNVLYGENLVGGMLENPLVQSSSNHLQKYHFVNSSIKIRE